MTDAIHTPFSAQGRFWRGNLHTHSTRSDGVLEPGEVCRRYRAEGYDFIALTDHFIGRYGYPVTETEAYRDGQFTTLLGAELHSGAMENGELWHILAVGLPKDFAHPNAPGFRPVPDQETGPEIAARARAAGAFVAIAHPEWSGLSTADARSIEAAHAVEVYNHGCAVECDRPNGFYTADRLFEEGRRLTLTATDDAHFAGPDAFGGWVMVKAEENQPEALLAALKAGQFYATQGPALHDIRLTGDVLSISCSAVPTIMVQGAGSAAVSVRGESLTQAEVPLTRFAASPWVRVTVMDRVGLRAWSNPIWLG